jgi:hypothetical protein
MRLRQTIGSRRNAEVAVLRVSAQAVGLEISLAVMADGDALLGARAPGGRRRGALVVRPLALMVFRAVNFTAALRAGDFFCAATRFAERDVGFCLAIAALPSR